MSGQEQRPLRIAQIVAGHGKGGLERHCIDLANGLAESGHAVSFVGDARFASELSGEVRLVPLDLSGWRRNPFLLRRLSRALRAEPFDVIHAQANKACALLAGVRGQVPGVKIATIHNMKRDLRPFAAMDGVIAVSRTVAAQLDHSRVGVVYNGLTPSVDTGDVPEGWIERTLGAAIRRPVVISVGRLVPAKGFDVLIEAWRGVPEGTLVILGEGPERPALEHRIREAGLQERVILAGHRDDVGRFLRDADLMVVSSRNEGFSYALVEGLQAGLPAIATRVPVAMEIFPESFIVPVGDARALGRRIEAFLANAAQEREAFRPVIDFARRELTLSAMVRNTVSFYRRVLGGV